MSRRLSFNARMPNETVHTVPDSPIKTLVYILSPSFSGSTLLTFLLARHPAIATVGELKARALGDIDHYSCSCGQRIHACTFWVTVTRMLFDRGIQLDVSCFDTHFSLPHSHLRDRLLQCGLRGPVFEIFRDLLIRVEPTCNNHFRRILDRNVSIAEVVAAVQGGALFLDASKDPLRLRYWLRRGPWPVKVIWLHRDGRGTTCSVMKHYNLPIEPAAREWRNAQEECERVIRCVPPPQYYRLAYEDLCRTPDAVLQNIFDFLEIARVPVDGDFRAIEHHILGNTMRLSSSHEIRLDDGWRHRLSRDDLAAFNRLAGDANRRSGYGDLASTRGT
jgi:hypothetical protein